MLVDSGYGTCIKYRVGSLQIAISAAQYDQIVFKLVVYGCAWLIMGTVHNDVQMCVN